jgi:hypothetical protein
MRSAPPAVQVVGEHWRVQVIAARRRFADDPRADQPPHASVINRAAHLHALGGSWSKRVRTRQLVDDPALGDRAVGRSGWHFFTSIWTVNRESRHTGRGTNDCNSYDCSGRTPRIVTHLSRNREHREHGVAADQLSFLFNNVVAQWRPIRPRARIRSRCSNGWGDWFEKLKRLVPTKSSGTHPRGVPVGVLLQARNEASPQTAESRPSRRPGEPSSLGGRSAAAAKTDSKAENLLHSRRHRL